MPILSYRGIGGLSSEDRGVNMYSRRLLLLALAFIVALQLPFVMKPSASIALDSFTITASSSAGGSIDPVGEVPVPGGEDITFTFTPEEGYFVASVFIDGVWQGGLDDYTFWVVTSNHTIAVDFDLKALGIDASAGLGGGIAPSGPITVYYGSSQSFEIISEEGYAIADVIVDGISVGAVTSYEFTNVTTDHVISVYFTGLPFTITASAGEHGSMSPVGEVPVTGGEEITFTFTPDEGYFVASVFIDGVWHGGLDDYTFYVTSNHTITVDFDLKALLIDASAGPGGGLAPMGEILLYYGSNQNFEVIPEAGYHVADVIVDGSSVGAVTSYEFTNVTTDHVISASFASDVQQAATWYLAEGCTEGGMEAWVLVQNPGDSDLLANLILQTSEGEQRPDGLQAVLIPARSRRSFFLNSYVTTWNVSTVVVASGDVICERALYGNGKTWAHNSMGVKSTSTTWYLAEGCTKGQMETWVLVQNPGGTDVQVDLTFMTPSGAKPGPAGFTIPAGMRHSFLLNDYVDDYSVSTLVEATAGVVCERAMYGPGRTWGHGSIGVTETAATWYMAEGCTDGHMDTWVLVQNPGTSEVDVSLTLMTGAGELKPGELQGVEIAAGTRRTFLLNDYVTDYNVSTLVTASGGVVCERAMYGNGNSWGHDSIGVISTAANWCLAEGCTEGGVETWILVQNPGDAIVSVDLTLMTGAGDLKPTELQGVEIAAGTRRSFRLNDYVTDWDVSALVAATGGVVVERAIYGEGHTWGTASAGCPITSPR